MNIHGIILYKTEGTIKWNYKQIKFVYSYLLKPFRFILSQNDAIDNLYCYIPRRRLYNVLRNENVIIFM